MKKRVDGKARRTVESVVVIGLGSMGRRRVRILKGFPDAPRIVGVNRNAERRAAAAAELGIEVFATLDEAIAAVHPQVALVCTSPDDHKTTVPACIDRGLDVFMELNLRGDWYPKAIRKAKALGRRLYVAATPLHRREMRYITEAVGGRPVNYIYHNGLYLPDWHPWQDYHEFFASRKATNGNREIFAVELPWMERAFGRVRRVHVMKGRMTKLDIDYPDWYMVSIEHEGGTRGFYCQDVVSRKGLRRLEVFSENLHVFWEGTPDSLSAYDFERKALVPVKLYDDVEQDSRYTSSVIENMYRDEMKSFFDSIADGSAMAYSLEDDRRTLAIIDRIEGRIASSRKGRASR